MRATYRIALYLAVVVSLPILTAIACSTPFHRYSLAWRPDGKIIAVKGQGVKLLDANLESLGPIYKDTNFGWSIAWNPKGDELVWANGDTARIWQQSSGMLRQVLASEPNVSTITWSPNGKWIATIGNRSIVVWDASLFQKYSMLRDPMNP